MCQLSLTTSTSAAHPCLLSLHLLYLSLNQRVEVSFHTGVIEDRGPGVQRIGGRSPGRAIHFRLSSLFVCSLQLKYPGPLGVATAQYTVHMSALALWETHLRVLL